MSPGCMMENFQCCKRYPCAAMLYYTLLAKPQWLMLVLLLVLVLLPQLKDQPLTPSSALAAINACKHPLLLQVLQPAGATHVLPPAVC
jgi:hypothetical protein